MTASIRIPARPSKLDTGVQVPPGVTAATALRLPYPRGSAEHETSGPTAKARMTVCESN
jgi:hypothetical protein